MNSLLNYASSEEEDDHEHGQKSASSAQVNTNSTNNSNLQTGQVGVAVADIEDPESHTAESSGFVGPARPSQQDFDSYPDLDHQTDQTPDIHEAYAGMSERDLLRQLTQPSHPVALSPSDGSGTADATTTARFRRFLELKENGVHFNIDLCKKDSFKNPNLFSSLLERAGLSAESQYTTTLPKDIFDVSMLPDWAYREELAKDIQIMDEHRRTKQKEQLRSGSHKVEFVTGSKPTT